MNLKVIPLGGLGEIGCNMLVLEINDEIIIIDCGLGFPDENLIGVDILIPNFDYLKQNQSKIKALFVTHAHEDHIGAIPFVLKEVTIPKIICAKFTAALIKHKLIENDLLLKTSIIEIAPKDKFKASDCFEVMPINCTHSIADSFSFIINTPLGLIVHTGDFKFDTNPYDGKLYDFQSIIEAGNANVILLLSDSTNIEKDGYTPSEGIIKPKFEEIFLQAKNRIIVTTFASNIHRLGQVIDTAERFNRKVAILGKSMLKYADIARSLGYINYPDSMIVSLDDLFYIPDEEVVILTTGSQGEPLSALSKIAQAEHKQIKVRKDDTVIFSASPIPGNERLVANTINGLFYQGANVIYGQQAQIHVSGHASKSEQRLMLEMVKPKYFVPVHGEYRMLRKHANLAVECNVNYKNVHVIENGDILEINSMQANIIGKTNSKKHYISGSRNYEINIETVNEKKIIINSGIVSISLVFDKNKNIVAKPKILTKGTQFVDDSLENTFADNLQKHLQSNISKSDFEDEAKFNNFINVLVDEYVNQNMVSKPLKQIHCHVIDNMS